MAFVEIDQTTKQPIQQPVQQVAAQAPTQQAQLQMPQLQIQRPPSFDVATFAAQEATRQMLNARANGAVVTQDMYEDARKEAYKQGSETLRQMNLEYQRQQYEYQKQIQQKSIEPFLPRQMSPDEIKDASGLLNAHNQIMTLFRQNQDIGANHVYRTTALGEPSLGAMVATDPNIRLFEATRGGSIISLGRGLLQDTGQVAGKEQAQDLIKQLMPGPGDSQQMAARKSIDMMQMEMGGLKAKIDALPQNVDSTPLRQAYANAYNDYAGLVNQQGSPAQKQFPLQSPQQLGWTTTAPAVQVNPAAQPQVKAGTSQGFSQTVSDQLNAQASGQAAQAPRFIEQPTGAATATEQARQFSGTSEAIGAAAQQAGQYIGGSRVMTPDKLVQPSQASMSQATAPQQAQETVFQTAPRAISKGAQAAVNWLGSILPENQPIETYQQ